LAVKVRIFPFKIAGLYVIILPDESEVFDGLRYNIEPNTLPVVEM